MDTIKCDGERESLHCVCQDLQVQSSSHRNRTQRGEERCIRHSYDQQVESASHTITQTEGNIEKDSSSNFQLKSTQDLGLGMENGLRLRLLN